MCAVVVMAHGKNNTIFGKDMGKVSIQDDILKRFSNESCPKMVGRPKLFIFQVDHDFQIVNLVFL